MTRKMKEESESGNGSYFAVQSTRSRVCGTCVEIERELAVHEPALLITAGR